MADGQAFVPHEAHLQSASDEDLARLRREHQEAEDRAQEVAWVHSEIVTKIMAEQTRRLVTPFQPDCASSQPPADPS